MAVSGEVMGKRGVRERRLLSVLALALMRANRWSRVSFEDMVFYSPLLVQARLILAAWLLPLECSFMELFTNSSIPTCSVRSSGLCSPPASSTSTRHGFFCKQRF